MARQAPAGLLSIDVNLPSTVPSEVAEGLNNADPAPSGLSDAEKAAFVQGADDRRQYPPLAPLLW
jgi:hypothetical protein